MLKEYTKYRFPDLSSKNDLIFEVNYKNDDETKDCKIIKWKIDEKEGFIQRKHLFEFLWFIGTQEDHRKMIPQTIRKTRYIEKFVGVKVTRDIRKGEMLNFKIALDVPLSEEELMAEVKKGKNDKIVKPI